MAANLVRYGCPTASASIESRHAELDSASIEHCHAELDSASLVQRRFRVEPGMTVAAGRNDGSGSRNKYCRNKVKMA